MERGSDRRRAVRGAALACAALTCAALMPACTPPQRSSAFLDASEAYRQAAAGPASQLAPLPLRAAEAWLSAAEQAAPGSSRERHCAYVALRKALLAIAVADARVMSDELARAAEGGGVRAAPAGGGEGDPGGSGDSGSSGDLGDLGDLGEDERGIVLSIPSDLLFRFRSAELLPAARQTLARVADAILMQPEDVRLLVEAHTDAHGPAPKSLELSRAQAERVRRVLIAEGVNPARVTAVGRGDVEPVADNATADGRARNRRVEIVIVEEDDVLPIASGRRASR
jgi:outer membrane protein OmpA-like peptidoglycan-associated protein